MALSSARSTDYRLPEGRPDIMGWPVVAEGDSRVGTVHDLLVEQDTRRLRYLEVDLDDREDTVLVPVGHARVDPQGHRVVLPGLQREVMRDMPAWGGRVEDLDAERERSLGQSWDATYGSTNYYQRPEFRTGVDDRGEASGTLARLDELDDYQVAEGEPDPQGWTVVDPSGAEIGKVDHLIGDTGIMKVRYLVLDMDEETPEGAHHILVPAGYVTLDEEEEEVLLEGVHVSGLGGIPRYEPGALHRQHEDEVTRALARRCGRRGRVRPSPVSGRLLLG
jgi:hypothetical protein